MSLTLVIVVVVSWVVVGLASGLWMARRGHDPLWILIALVLGPLFVPIAVERVQRRPGLAAWGRAGVPPHRSSNGAELRVLVGSDGSADSERALAATLHLVGDCGLVVLAEVVRFEEAEFADRTEVDSAARRLAGLANCAHQGNDIRTEVLTGAPGAALCRFAEEQDMDLLVVGRRGRGLSSALLGSVSTDVVQHSSVPVLVVEPARGPQRSATHRRDEGHISAHSDQRGA